MSGAARRARGEARAARDARAYQPLPKSASWSARPSAVQRPPQVASYISGSALLPSSHGSSMSVRRETESSRLDTSPSSSAMMASSASRASSLPVLGGGTGRGKRQSRGIRSRSRAPRRGALLSPFQYGLPQNGSFTIQSALPFSSSPFGSMYSCPVSGCTRIELFASIWSCARIAAAIVALRTPAGARKPIVVRSSCSTHVAPTTGAISPLSVQNGIAAAASGSSSFAPDSPSSSSWSAWCGSASMSRPVPASPAYDQLVAAPPGALLRGGDAQVPRIRERESGRRQT